MTQEKNLHKREETFKLLVSLEPKTNREFIRALAYDNLKISVDPSRLFACVTFNNSQDYNLVKKELASF